MKAVDMTQRVKWNTEETKTRIKSQASTYIDHAADSSRENTKTWLRTIIPNVFNMALAFLRLPLTLAKSINDHYSGQVIEKCDPVVDDCATCSSDVAKRSMNLVTDTAVDAADSSRRFYSWLY